MQARATVKGFTLVEVLIALAITGVLLAVAIPRYSSYVTRSRENVARTNLQTLKLAEEAYFFDHNAYKGGKYDPTGGTDTLGIAALGWKPDLDGNKFVYEVVVGTCGGLDCVIITVTGFDGTTVVTE